MEGKLHPLYMSKSSLNLIKSEAKNPLLEEKRMKYQLSTITYS